MPGDEYSCEQENGRSKDKWPTDAVNPQIQSNAQFIGPGETLNKLIAPFGRVIGKENIERGQQGNAGRNGGC